MLEIRVVRRPVRIVFPDDDTFVYENDNQVDKEDGHEQAVVFNLPKRELIVDEGEQEGRRAGAERGGKEVAERQPTFASENKRQNDENKGAEEDRLEIEREIDAGHADKNERMELQRTFFQFMRHHRGDVLTRRAVGVEKTDDIRNRKIKFHREELAGIR